MYQFFIFHIYLSQEYFASTLKFLLLLTHSLEATAELSCTFSEIIKDEQGKLSSQFTYVNENSPTLFNNIYNCLLIQESGKL